MMMMEGGEAARRPIKGVLFDLDGLLLDTEPLYFQAMQQIMDEYGAVYDDKLRSNVIGTGELYGAELIVKDKNLPMTAHEFLDRREKIIVQLFPDCQPMPGAKELVDYFHKQGLPIAVATSSVKAMVDIKLQKHSDWLTSKINFLISGDHPSVKKGKPAPDIFLAAADGIGIDPRDCIVFEDSPSGTEAGASAGCTVISIQADPILTSDRYPRTNALLKSLNDWHPENYGLPARH